MAYYSEIKVYTKEDQFFNLKIISENNIIFLNNFNIEFSCCLNDLDKKDWSDILVKCYKETDEKYYIRNFDLKSLDKTKKYDIKFKIIDSYLNKLIATFNFKFKYGYIFSLEENVIIKGE